MESEKRDGGSAAAARPALAESRKLRLFAVFILYVAQGVPIGLFWFAIPPGWRPMARPPPTSLMFSA